MSGRVGEDHEVLRRALTDAVSVVNTVPDHPEPESAWQSICESDGDAWFVEKVDADGCSQSKFIVYRAESPSGGDAEWNRYLRRDFLDTFESAERAATFINERA